MDMEEIQKQPVETERLAKEKEGRNDCDARCLRDYT
jgi:hypothetical protein